MYLSKRQHLNVESDENEYVETREQSFSLPSICAARRNSKVLTNSFVQQARLLRPKSGSECPVGDKVCSQFHCCCSLCLINTYSMNFVQQRARRMSPQRWTMTGERSHVSTNNRKFHCFQLSQNSQQMNSIEIHNIITSSVWNFTAVTYNNRMLSSLLFTKRQTNTHSHIWILNIILNIKKWESILNRAKKKQNM